jgi:hypothetical protein
MAIPSIPSFGRAVLAAVLCATFGAGAQQNVPPPKVQLWIDVSTGGMAGMPDMEMPAGMGPALTYGMARGHHAMPPRVLDIALFNSLRPGAPASQAIPPGMRLGSSLPLLPPPQQAAQREREPGEMTDDMRREMPKGRILIYWGCGDTVRRGQPRVIDLARGNPADLGAAFAGRHAADRGARVTPRHVLYPNDRSRTALARDSSLVGEHRIEGDGVPASMRFTLGEAQNLMPAIDLRSRGGLADSIALSWPTIPHARAYYLHAMGQVGNDMVLWSSAETGDSGMGLFDYLPNATIDRWVRENVLLKPDTTACAVPKGIFAAPDSGGRRSDGNAGAMLRMIAYGGESNFIYPVMPADARARWEPEWAVRVRVKSSTMAQLGQEQSGQGPAVSTPGGGTAAEAAPATPAQGVLESVLPIPGGLIRGLFGR